VHILLGGAFPKRHRANCGVIAVIRKVPILGRHKQGQHQAAGSGAGKASIAEIEEVMMIEETWMQPYLAYMINKTLPGDTVEAKRIIR
jgi:hypothetical protein